MNSALAAALVTGPLSVLLSFCLAHLFSKDRLQRSKITKARGLALTGKWRGTLTQEASSKDGPMEGELEFDLRCGRRTVRGSGVLWRSFDGHERAISFGLKGGFLFERFLRMEYGNDKGHVVQFGSVVTELVSEGDRLRGRFVGYGSMSEDIVSGTISLTKCG